MMPVHAARDVLCLQALKVLCIADCSSAIVSNRRANPSSMLVVDKVRLEFARWAALSPTSAGAAQLPELHLGGEVAGQGPRPLYGS